VAHHRVISSLSSSEYHSPFLNITMTLLTRICSLERASDCEWKAQAGNVCVASFDWKCSGVCNPVERLKYVHSRCSEGDDAVWSASF
jgi:hypothetical protein